MRKKNEKKKMKQLKKIIIQPNFKDYNMCTSINHWDISIFVLYIYSAVFYNNIQ